jgi:O-antigen/teichoic acid export membrane protein
MLKNLATQWLATINVIVVSVATSLFLARSLGPESFGIYSYFLAMGFLIAAAQDSRFNALLAREKIALSPTLSSQPVIFVTIRR